MKRKLYLFILLMLFLFIFDRSSAFLLRELNFSFYSNAKLKKNVFGKPEVMKKGFYDALIFGTSRTLSAIHPVYIYQYLGLKAYNVAKQDRYPEYYYNFYKRFRKNFGKPDYLFYGVDYFMFKAHTSKIALMSVSKRKRRVRRIDLSKAMNRESVFFSRISLLFRMKKKFDKTFEDVIYLLSLEYDIAENTGTNIAGISTHTGVKMVISPEHRYKPESWEKFNYINSSHGEGEFLKKLFDELENDRVQVFLIGIPDYIGTFESNVQKKFFSDDILSLIKGRKDFWFLDYNHPEKFDIHNPEFFKNGRYGLENSHMSYYGSIPFNKILTDDVRRIIAESGSVDPEQKL